MEGLELYDAAFGYMFSYSLHVAQQAEHLLHEKTVWGRFKQSGLILRSRRLSRPDRLESSF